jgi:hypothetical protein
MIDYGDYINGHIERKKSGAYEGGVTIDGITLPSIQAVFFVNDNGEKYLWLKRKKILEYDSKTQTYKEREAKPQWEAYLKKQKDGDTIAYKGNFIFMRFKYSVIGVWDRILGMDRQRLNLYVERLPMNEQTIINSVNETKKKYQQ